MLNDEHLKVVMYKQGSSDLFPGTDIKGGVVITYHDVDKDFGKIGTFIIFKELKSILDKVTIRDDFKSFSSMVYPHSGYKLTKKLHDDHPKAKKCLSKGNLYGMQTNIFDSLDYLFLDDEPNDDCEYIRVFGRQNNK